MNFYQTVYQKLYFPFFETCLKGRETSQIYKRALQTQRVPTDKLVTLQEASVKKLLLHAEQTCPYYQQVFAESGFDAKNFSSLADLRKLPLLTKNDIRNNSERLISEKHKNNIWFKSTGGSTGQPLHFGYTEESYSWRVAMSKRGYSWAGAFPGTKQAYIWGVQLGKTSRIRQFKEKLHHYIDRQLYFNCFDFDEKAMKQCLSSLNRFRPTVIIGYTNPLFNFAQYVGCSSKLQFVPKGIICAAEKVHPYQREVIERTFGSKVFNTYGSREFMLIASECEKHEGLHVSAENLVVEIIKDDGMPAGEGETGKIVVTDLHNYGMPFIRYEIGDLATAAFKPCSCGRGLPLIADVVGRSLDMIRTPEGKVVPGEFFPHLIKDFPEIARFQVVQESLDLLVIKLVPSSELNRLTKKRIESEVREKIGQGMRIEYEVLSDIPLTKTGKFRVTVSRLKDDAKECE